MKKLIFAVVLPVVVLTSCATENNSGTSQPNILFIAVDDLRPELNCYGAGHIISPNIDRLAAEGVLFQEAYTQQAVCAPSRNTLMTGLRPDGLGIHDLGTFFRKNAPHIPTLTQLFMENGYVAEGMGKIYHTGHGNQDDSLSWSTKFWSPSRIVNQREEIQSGDTVKLQTCFPLIGERKIPWLKSRMAEEMHIDALAASHAIERMNALKDTSFFLAVGFRKPHLPFVAPAKYWDLYNEDKIIVPSSDKPDAPSYAFANFGELRNYHGMPATGYVDPEDAKKLIHGYYACVSYIDAQVGLLIEELKRLKLYENTIIVFWGDHGWKLGDYGEWCKHTNFEIDTRIPVIVRAPGLTAERGWKSDVIIETVDIYPTLCELAGLGVPSHVQGTSFKPALEDAEYKWDDVAFSQYPRSVKTEAGMQSLMGTSMRTSGYRLTRWVDIATGITVAEELYDNTNDRSELTNLTGNEDYLEKLIELNQVFDKEYKREHQ